MPSSCPEGWRRSASAVGGWDLWDLFIPCVPCVPSASDGHRPPLQRIIDDLFSNKATRKEIQPATRAAIIDAIGRVKILDPACGSGAFPMGALHRLVDLLQKLDPANERWREVQRQRATAETEVAFKSGDRESREQRLKEINDTFEFNSSDYGRKLYLIENAIYGVDIQPVAVQIAKFRFFIALVVDQRVRPQESNLGVRPLPNLETRLVAADTLIPIPRPQLKQASLFGDDASAHKEVEKLKQRLTAVSHEHFNARDPRQKRVCREQDQSIRAELSAVLKQTGMDAPAAAKLAAWDPYDQNDFAPFFDSEWMCGLPIGKVSADSPATPATLRGNLGLINETSGQTELTESAAKVVDSGFDVVIGNPPYIRIQTLKQKDPGIVAFYKDHYASAAKGNYDIYVVFIEAGLNLLKSDGHLAYICPHRFFNAQYGEPIRKVIADGQHLRHVVHFGDQQVFPGASIYTCLLFLENGGTPECRFVKVTDIAAWKRTLAGIDGKFLAGEDPHLAPVTGPVLIAMGRDTGAPHRAAHGSSGGEGFQQEDGSAGDVGFCDVEGEEDGPVVEVIGIDEGLFDGEVLVRVGGRRERGEMGVAGVAGLGIEPDEMAGVVIGIEQLEQALVGPGLAGGIGGFYQAERGFGLVAGQRGDQGEEVVAQVPGEAGAVAGERGRGTLGFEI